MGNKFFNKRQLDALAVLEVRVENDNGIIRDYDEVMLDVDRELYKVEDMGERERLRDEIAGIYKTRKANLVSHVRAGGDGASNQKKLRGYPVLFNMPTKLYGEWKEVIADAAFEGVDLSGLMLLFAHDTSKPLGRNGVNLRAEVDQIGLFIEAEMPDTTLGNDIYSLVEKQIIDGMSFMFYPEVIETDWENKTDTIKKFRKVPEVSIVTFPAYPQTVIQPTEEALGGGEGGQRMNAGEVQKREKENMLKLLELGLLV